MEKRGEKEELLDDLIDLVNKKAESTRYVKKGRTEHEKRLVAAGESI